MVPSSGGGRLVRPMALSVCCPVPSGEQTSIKEGGLAHAQTWVTYPKVHALAPNTTVMNLLFIILHKS